MGGAFAAKAQPLQAFTIFSMSLSIFFLIDIASHEAFHPRHSEMADMKIF